MARASPSARVAVVLAVGAMLNGQASSGTVILRTISLWRARGLSVSAVRAMMGIFRRLTGGIRAVISSEEPE